MGLGCSLVSTLLGRGGPTDFGAPLSSVINIPLAMENSSPGVQHEFIASCIRFDQITVVILSGPSLFLSRVRLIDNNNRGWIFCL